MEINDFITKADVKYREIIEKLINVLNEGDPKLVCAVKWNQLVFAVNSDFHHWICSISVTKKYVGLNFHFGSYLTDCSNILKAGSSRFLRQIQISSLSEIDEPAITDLLRQAVNKLDEFKRTWQQK
jgi:hypothetical protein